MLKHTQSPIYWAEHYQLEQIQVNARVTLLQEGEKAQKIYIIKQGCLRLCTNNNGTEITNQFFFEGKLVASLESFLSNQPSDYYLETIEKSTLYVLDKTTFDTKMRDDTAFKEWVNQYILDRFIFYSKHLLSFLRDKPEERYRKLVEKSPQVTQRIPQHYIASYLGITPVSLSRIKNKVLREAKTK